VSAGVADTAVVAVSAGAADSAAASASAFDSAAVEMVMMAPPVLGCKKPPRWVGKRFWDRFAAALLLKA
jgi:hypothetical protein